VSEYVARSVNAPADFTNPDNLALDKNGNLFIAEDTNIGTGGMDIWAAIPDPGNQDTAATTKRFASLTDCTAEPSGIYFDRSGTTLFVNVLHRAGADLGVMITRDR
jgi:uncharacterized protein